MNKQADHRTYLLGVPIVSLVVFKLLISNSVFYSYRVLVKRSCVLRKSRSGCDHIRPFRCTNRGQPPKWFQIEISFVHAVSFHHVLCVCSIADTLKQTDYDSSTMHALSMQRMSLPKFWIVAPSVSPGAIGSGSKPVEAWMMKVFSHRIWLRRVSKPLEPWIKSVFSHTVWIQGWGARPMITQWNSAGHHPKPQ